MLITDFSDQTTGERASGWAYGTVENIVVESGIYANNKAMSIARYRPVRLTGNIAWWSGAGDYSDCHIAYRFRITGFENASNNHLGGVVKNGGRLTWWREEGDGIRTGTTFRSQYGAQFYTNEIRLHAIGGDPFATFPLPEPVYFDEFSKSFWARLEVGGTYPDVTIKAKIWEAEKPEPPGWMAVATTSAIHYEPQFYDANWDYAEIKPQINDPGSIYFYHSDLKQSPSSLSYYLDVCGVDTSPIDISSYLNSPIVGTVVGLPSNTPVENANVRVEAISKLTGEDGTFSLSLPPGIKSVQVSSLPLGYVPDASTSISVNHNAPGTFGLEFHFTEIAYDIKTPLDLFHMRYDQYGTYRLMNDIDMEGFVVPEYDQWGAGESWSPTDMRGGELDGLGHTIKNLTVPEDWSAGFLYEMIFTYEMPEIKNVNFENINVIGYDSVGIIAGINEGIIRNCSVNGTVASASWSSGDTLGGIAGTNTGQIIASHSDVSIVDGGNVGGITGNNEGVIENCYHRGTLGGDAAGGIAGINGGMIRNCYHAGNCRVVGEYNLGDVVNSYYDGELSGLNQDNTYLGLARTTKEMTWPGDFNVTYIGWDFPDLWKIAPDANDGYPQFEKHVAAVLLGGTVMGTSSIFATLNIKGLLMIAGTISAESDWQALITRFVALKGTVDAVSWWQAYKILIQVWAKRKGQYEKVVPYVKVNGFYQPITQTMHKSNDEWKV